MPHIPRALCRGCLIEMLIHRNGVCIEMLATWGSYYKIYCDEYRCPVCQRTVLLPAERIATMHVDQNYERHQAHKTATFADAVRKER